MSSRVILVLIDGLAWHTACDCMGVLQALCNAGRGARYRLQCELPSLSRPLYECILTGRTPADSGVLHNGVTRPSQETGIFHLARAAGRSTAAAAYHWISELYNRSPYLPARDRFTDDVSLPIQHGVFYHRDDYPDDHLLLDAEALRRRHAPDLLLAHSMNVDDAGHRAGGRSADYRNAARRIDTLLAHYLTDWLADGYQVLVTSDHGMNDDCSHGGMLDEERLVPLYVFGDRFSLQPGLAVRQTELCGVMADLLGVPHDKPSHPALLG